jgi:3D (Asp-Asp-Asp) domain-containing protein
MADNHKIIARRRRLVIVLAIVIFLLLIRLASELSFAIDINPEKSGNYSEKMVDQNHYNDLRETTAAIKRTVIWKDFTATAYGPPWDTLNGSGITSTGIQLSGPACIIAVDPRVIDYHSTVIIKPSLHTGCRTYKAEDTGGAIIGNRIDIYDWRGRETQYAWGLRNVKLAVIR